MTSTLNSGSTVPLFISEFAGAAFFDTPQEGGGLYAAGIEDQTNILLFPDTNDVAVGGDEVDIISGGAGVDNIMGAEGTDFMFGGTGDDIVRGGQGDDVVVGNEGSDVLISGEGSDIYEFFADQFIEGDLDVILDFESNDAIVVIGSTDVEYNNQTGSVFVDGLEVASLEAGLELDVLAREDSSVIFTNGGTAEFSSSSDTSDETASESTESEEVTESIEASSGLLGESTVPLFISEFAGAAFFDTPQEGGGLYAAGIEDQTNILLFPDTNDVAVGGDEVDIISGGAGVDNIMGAEGSDFMFGGTGDDIVRGGQGDDVVVGNEGSDVLISGEGSDIYEFFADQFIEGDLDVILDFEIDRDALVFIGNTDVSYNAQTGLVSVDGMEVVSLEAGLDLDVTIREDSSVIA